MTRSAGLFSLIVFVLAACAPGEAVGQVDAMKPSSLDVDAVAGDTLRFRVDVEVEWRGEDAPSRKTVEALNRSQLAVTVEDSSGSTTVRCPLKGNGTMQSKSGKKVYEKGLIVACEVPVRQSSKQQVSATVIWDPAIQASFATVEVRKVKK